MDRYDGEKVPEGCRCSPVWGETAPEHATPTFPARQTTKPGSIVKYSFLFNVAKPELHSSYRRYGTGRDYTPPHKSCPFLPAVLRRRLAPPPLGSSKLDGMSIVRHYPNASKDMLNILWNGNRGLLISVVVAT